MRRGKSSWSPTLWHSMTPTLPQTWLSQAIGLNRELGTIWGGRGAQRPSKMWSGTHTAHLHRVAGSPISHPPQHKKSCDPFIVYLCFLGRTTCMPKGENSEQYP